MLKFYLKHTECFRSSEKKGIFLSVKKPSLCGVKANIFKMDCAVNKISKRTFHLIIGPSWALLNDASMKAILEAAGWSKETTFTKFYLRDENITFSSILSVSNIKNVNSVSTADCQGNIVYNRAVLTLFMAFGDVLCSKCII